MNLETVSTDVLRRAEMFDFIADLVRSWPFPADLPDGSQPVCYQSTFAAASIPAKSIGRDILPHIAVIDQKFACNAAYIDLQHRPLMLRLFSAFCEADDWQLTRDDILRKVYLLDELDHRSERFLDAKYCNATKLISRARILAGVFLGRALRYGVEWFVYDQERRIWCLFRMRNEYFNNFGA